MITHQDTQARTTKGRIRMAYSFNGTQPVLCTILCDQPLYYMEEALFEEEEQGLFLEEEQAINAALGADAAPLMRKINIYDGVAKKFEREADARLQEFIENARSFGTAAPDGENLLARTLAALSTSRYAQSMLECARTLGADIMLSDQVRGATYDATNHVVLFNPDQTDGDAQLMLIAALRRMIQINNGAGRHPLAYFPDEAVLVNRAQAADLAVTQIRAAWEMQLAGQPDAWARLEQSQACDLARAFAREALSDFRTLNNGKAAQAAFESWFLSDRCKIVDRDLIQAMLTDHETQHFAQSCDNLHVSFFAALGEQTLGRNYLADMAGLIMSDPVFSDVRDRSNANFLWFVKFERSFKNAEQQADDETQADDPARRPEDSFPFPAVQHGAGSEKEAGLENMPGRSNIVYVSFGGCA